MNRFSLIFFLFAAGNLSSLFAQGQFDELFVKHLSKENQRIEHLQYLESLTISADSLQYLLAKYHLQYGDEPAFYHAFQHSEKLFLRDTLAVGYASCYYLQTDTLRKERQQWFAEIESLQQVHDLKQLISIASIDRMKARQINVDLYPNVLRADLMKYKKMAGRSPVKSAILSAFVPGLGKFYIGKYRLGFNMLFMNGLFMAQTYESVHQLGWTHPLSLFNLLLASLFYASNIYGSYRDTRYFQQETLQQLYFDAANYYSTTHFPSLYR